MDKKNETHLGKRRFVSQEREQVAFVSLCTRLRCVVSPAPGALCSRDNSRLELGSGPQMTLIDADEMSAICAHLRDLRAAPLLWQYGGYQFPRSPDSAPLRSG